MRECRSNSYNGIVGPVLFVYFEVKLIRQAENLFRYSYKLSMIRLSINFLIIMAYVFKSLWEQVDDLNGANNSTPFIVNSKTHLNARSWSSKWISFFTNLVSFFLMSIVSLFLLPFCELPHKCLVKVALMRRGEAERLAALIHMT